MTAVELPEASFPNTDFASAFFGVSVNKALTAEQCGFPDRGSAIKKITDNKSDQKIEDKTVAASGAAQPGSAATAPVTVSSSTETATEASSAKASSTESSAAVEAGKLKIGDAELLAKESVAGEGARQDDAKYYRTFQNGACYEFALNVTTIGKDEAGMKHVDRDKVFDRLEKILATVEIATAKAEPVATAEFPAAEKAASTAAVASAQTPAQ